MADDQTATEAPVVDMTPALQAEMAGALAEIAAMQGGGEEEPAALAKPVEPAKAEPAAEEATPADSKRIALIMRREAEAKRAADDARAERQALARDREAARAELDALRKAKEPAAPASDDEEDLDELLVKRLGKDAPDDLVIRTKLRARARANEKRLAELEARLAKRDEEATQAQQATQEREMEQRARVHLRSNVIPKFTDELAGVRALASDDEFAEGVLGPGIARFRQLYAEQGEGTTPEEAFRPLNDTLVRMTKRLLADPVFARAVGYTAPAAAKTQPTPADEKKPAQPPKTLSNAQHVTSTRARAPSSMDEEYLAALDEVRALRQGTAS